MKNSYDVHCPRFATMLHDFGAGLGHKFAEVLFGMVLAEETNSTYVLDDRTWVDEGDHGSYAWLLDFLPLDKSEFTLSELEHISTNQTSIRAVYDRWETVIRESKAPTYSCHVLFSTHMYWCCLNAAVCYCTLYEPLVGTYDRLKWRMRETFSRSNYFSSPRLGPVTGNEARVSIAWHLRQGDIVLNANEEHFDRLASQIASVLHQAPPIPFHFYFIGETNITKDFPFLPALCERHFHGNCSNLHVDVRDALLTMVGSDVLITSGSSFANLAAMLRTDGLTLYEYPKEMFLGIYEVSGQGLVHPNGTIEKPSLQDLKYRLNFIYHQKMKKTLGENVK
jgi:hypothetical protein